MDFDTSKVLHFSKFWNIVSCPLHSFQRPPPIVLRSKTWFWNRISPSQAVIFNAFTVPTAKVTATCFLSRQSKWGMSWANFLTMQQHSVALLTKALRKNSANNVKRIQKLTVQLLINICWNINRQKKTIPKCFANKKGDILKHNGCFCNIYFCFSLLYLVVSYLHTVLFVINQPSFVKDLESQPWILPKHHRELKLPPSPPFSCRAKRWRSTLPLTASLVVTEIQRIFVPSCIYQS